MKKKLRFSHFFRKKSMMFGFVLIMGILLVALFAEQLSPNNPLEVDISRKLQLPSWNYWLGTDHLGRCEASRLIWGTRISLQYCLGVLSIMVCVGVPIGMISGYFGGAVDAVIMRVIDIMLALPSMMVAMAVAGILGANIHNLVIAIASVWWASYARLIRNMTLQIKSQDFMMAAKVNGCTHTQMIFKHILRNIAGPLFVMCTLQVGPIILTIAGFSFIGLGAQPPMPEWGVMLSDGKVFLQAEPRLMLYPGIAILVTTMAFNLFGMGLRDEIGIQNDNE